MASALLPVLRRSLSSSTAFARLLSTSTGVQAGQKIRLSRGEAPDGIAYGPLTDLPDWSYADGTPAPETKRRRRRLLRRLDVGHCIATYLEEVEKAARKKDKEGNLIEESGEPLENGSELNPEKASNKVFRPE